MFWMLSRNIDRLRAEEDVRNLQVARAAQADGEGVKAFMEGLQLRIGRPVVTDKVYDPRKDKADPDAKEQLMQILAEDDKGMSQNVEFILSLEDKQFTASIDRAGKLLTRFGEQATKPAQKINNLERSLGSVSRIIGVLESKLDVTAENYRM